MSTNTQPTRTWSPRMAIAALMLSTALGTGVAWSAGEFGTQAGTPPLNAPGSVAIVKQAGFADLVAKVQPAVVQIATLSDTVRAEGPDVGPDQMPNLPPGLRRFFGDNGRMFQMPRQPQQQPRGGLGSGFIIDPDGYVVTNNHVVDGARQVKVTLTDGNEYTAKVVGRDPQTDIALVKIDAGKPLPYVAFGDSSTARVGDWVIAVGNPYGLSGTVTAGIISAHDRNINAGAYDDFLQIDAPINPGNSGGPLFDQSGGVIGIDTSIYSPSGGNVGIGFAIPSNLAKNVVAQLRENGKVERGWLGVQMQAMTPALAKAVGLPDNSGVLIDEVQDNSPAAKAELRQGDVITKFNGVEIKTPRDLAVAVADVRAGKSATMSVWRDGSTRTVEIAIGSKPDDKVAAAEPGSQQSKLGMTLQPLDDDSRDQLGLDPAAKGVVVGQVEPGSKAWESGLRPGDVITRVGNETVSNPAQAEKTIRAAQRDKKEHVAVAIKRDGSTRFLGLQLGNG